MADTKAKFKCFGPSGPLSKGEAIIQFFSLTCAAEIYTWDEEHLDNWIIDKIHVFDERSVCFYFYDISFEVTMIAERNLETGVIQLRSSTDYDNFCNYFDMSKYFECGSKSIDGSYAMMLKPRVFNCLECEECLSCVTRGWPLNKK